MNSHFKLFKSHCFHGVVHGHALSFLLVLALFTLPAAESTPSPGSIDQYSRYEDRLYPSVTIVMLALILVFVVTGCLGIYICNRTNVGAATIHLLPAVSTISETSHHNKLHRSEIEALPTFTYSDVVKHGLKVGKSSLECAICLTEFEDHHSLRLLPRCDHVFHPSCIDSWLTSRPTCPVCRTDLLCAPDKLADGRLSTSSSDDDDETCMPHNSECGNPARTVEFEFLTAGAERSREPSSSYVQTAAGTGIRNWKLKRSNSTGGLSSTGFVNVIIDGDLGFRDRFRLTLTEGERRRIMGRSEEQTRRATLLPLLPSDRTRYRIDTSEGGDGSDGQCNNTLLRWCSEPVRIGGCHLVKVDAEEETAEVEVAHEMSER